MTTKTRKPLRENKNRLSYLIENELEKAELVLAVKAITDKLQDMAEELAKIEADEIMPMSDSLKTAFGPQVAEQFSTAAKGKIRELVGNVSAAKDAISAEVDRLEQAVTGEPSNDMAMPDAGADASAPSMGGADASGGGEDIDAEAESAAGGAETGAMGGGDASGGGEDIDAEAEAAAGGMGDDTMNAAGRQKKESVIKRGRRIMENIPLSVNAPPEVGVFPTLHRLSDFDPRAGVIAFEIHELIHQGRFDGKERAGLMNILMHLAKAATDARHWEDPDAKVESALIQNKIDMRLPGVRDIISKLKKLAHIISLKHDGMMESKRVAQNIKSLRESKNPDALVLREFRSVFAKSKNATHSVKMVAENFSIDPTDVVAIVREAKKTSDKINPLKKKVSDKSKPVAKVSPKRTTSKVDESQSPWVGVIESDTKRVSKRLAEQQPQKPRTPADMHADRVAAAQSQSDQAPFQPPQGKATPPQQQRQVSGQTTQMPPAAAPKGPRVSPGQTPQGQQQVAQRPSGGNQQPPQTPLPPPNSSTPVGQAPQKTDATAPAMPKIPGKEIKTTTDIPPVTLMSKPTGFPKPGAPINSSGAQPANANPVAESKTRKPARRLAAR
ncbi:unnamed protein product [Sphagnum tenellum]